MGAQGIWFRHFGTAWKMLSVAVILSLAVASHAVLQTADIVAGEGANGWCSGGRDAAPDAKHGVATTVQECMDKCVLTFPDTIAVDFWDITHPLRNDNNICWCQDKCDCLAPSASHKGDGKLGFDDTKLTARPTGVCYKIHAGVGDMGWCPGNDAAPDLSKGTPQSPLDCFNKCTEKFPNTIAVDFYDVNHPSRTEANVCWCQDKCDCMKPSKADAGDGTLYVKTDSVRGRSCGTNMMTVSEGNNNGVCHGTMKDPANNDSTSLWKCHSACAEEKMPISTFFAHNKVCKCQEDCDCTERVPSGMGPGYVIHDKAGMIPCDAGHAKCSDVKHFYKGNACCGNPTKKFSFLPDMEEH